MTLLVCKFVTSTRMRKPKTCESSSTSICGGWYGTIAVAVEESGVTGCDTGTMEVVVGVSDTDELDLIIVVLNGEGTISVATKDWNACNCWLITWKSGHNTARSPVEPFGNMLWPFAAKSEVSLIFATTALILLPRVTNDTRHNQLCQVI